MAAEFKQAWMKTNRIAVPREYGALQVVVQKLTRRAAKKGKGVDVRLQKVFQPLVKKEFEIERAAVRQRHHEAGKPTARASDLYPTEGSPIHLRLFAGEGRETKESFARRGPQFFDAAPQLMNRAGETTIAQHFEQAGGAQTRMPLQDLAREGFVRFQHARLGLGRDGYDHAQSVFDGVRVQVERSGDGTDLPMLGVKEATNFSDGFRCDHYVQLVFTKGLSQRPTRPHQRQTSTPSAVRAAAGKSGQRHTNARTLPEVAVVAEA